MIVRDYAERPSASRFVPLSPTVLPVFAAVSLLFFLASVELSVDWSRPILAKGVPVFSLSFLVRSLVIAAVSFGLVAAFWRLRAALPAGCMPPDHAFGPASWALLLIPVSLALLFLVSPPRFSEWSIPGGPVEELSAIFLFLAGATCVFAGARAKGPTGRTDGWVYVPAMALSGIFFLIALEEVSWFQAYLDTETPGWLAELNSQNETNLHNINTNLSEIVYYGGAFVLLVILPFIKDLTTGGLTRLRQHSLERSILGFIPGRVILFAGIPLVAFNYDTWNIAVTQLIFFLSCGIVLYYLSSAHQAGDWPAKIYLSALLAALIGIQYLFLSHGEQFGRLWEAREYKELLIPTCLLLYSIQLPWQLREASKGACPPNPIRAANPV